MFTGTILSYARGAVHRYERFSGVSYGAKPLMTQGYSLAEEIANSISHGIGLVFGIVGFGAVVGSGGRGECGYDGYRQLQFIWREHDPAFLASTLYHAIPHQRAKIWLKKFDHCAIYLLIAGTYTPFLLVGLDSPLARGLMIVIWSPALFGILFVDDCAPI